MTASAQNKNGQMAREELAVAEELASRLTFTDHDIEKMKAEAQIEMYEMLVMLPEKSHAGECGPESGCDANCMDVSHFCDYVEGIYELCGRERLSTRVMAAIRKNGR